MLKLKVIAQLYHHVSLGWHFCNEYKVPKTKFDFVTRKNLLFCRLCESDVWANVCFYFQNGRFNFEASFHAILIEAFAGEWVVLLWERFPRGLVRKKKWCPLRKTVRVIVVSTGWCCTTAEEGMLWRWRRRTMNMKKNVSESVCVCVWRYYT